MGLGTEILFNSLSILTSTGHSLDCNGEIIPLDSTSDCERFARRDIESGNYKAVLVCSSIVPTIV